jgi:hypothetical protein
MVWSFLKAAGNLVDELDSEDEVKLLRLRTKKNELVIVPGMYARRSAAIYPLTGADPRFILVAIHDTPPA